MPDRHSFCGECGFDHHVRDVESSHQGSGADTQFFGILQTPGRAKLIVVKGVVGDGISYALNAKEHIAGRASGVILFPDDDWLSSAQCNFLCRESGLYLSDLESQNGTFLRTRAPVCLADGDLFSCGQQLFSVKTLDDRTEFPSEDGTLHYVSPGRHESLQVTQILEGGKLGLAVASPAGEILIGREGCDLTVSTDPHLSKRHAKVSLERDGRVLLTDLGSKNGTFTRIKGEVQLNHGDFLAIGRELLRVEIVE